MKISNLKANKFSQRVSVFLDGNFAFSLHPQIVLENSLEINQGLNDSQVENLIINSLKLELYTLSLDKILIKPRSTNEITVYLIKVLTNKKFNLNPITNHIYTKISKNYSTLINQTIQKLKQNHYLDELKFAQYFISQKQESAKKGKIFIKSQLLKKGLNLDIINQVLSDKSVFDPLDNQQNIKDQIDKNYRKIAYKNYPKLKLKKLLINRLISRGFSYQEIAKQIDEYLLSK